MQVVKTLDELLSLLNDFWVIYPAELDQFADSLPKLVKFWNYKAPLLFIEAEHCDDVLTKDHIIGLLTLVQLGFELDGNVISEADKIVEDFQALNLSKPNDEWKQIYTAPYNIVKLGFSLNGYQATLQEFNDKDAFLGRVVEELKQIEKAYENEETSYLVVLTNKTLALFERDFAEEPILFVASNDPLISKVLQVSSV